MAACTSPSSAKRSRIVQMSKSATSQPGSSAQVTGALTVASGRARTLYAEAIVWSRAIRL
jgi:hypothetical protein